MICSINLVISIPTCRVSGQRASPTLSYRMWASHRCATCLAFTLIIGNSKRGKQTCLWCSQEPEGPSLTKWWVRSRWKEQCKGACKLDALSAVHRPVASPSFSQATCVGWVFNGVIDSSTLFLLHLTCQCSMTTWDLLLHHHPTDPPKTYWSLPGIPSSCLHLPPQQSTSGVISTELNVVDPVEVTA